MSRPLFAEGCHGWIIAAIQRELEIKGHYRGSLDGRYGDVTAQAVGAYQAKTGLETTGQVDDATWVDLMGGSVSSVFERCLQLTAAFEGYGFGEIRGNWDGAWLTWGIVGFTLRHGELREIFQELLRDDPGVIREAFGALTDELVVVMRGSREKQEIWANRISLGPERLGVARPWKMAFRRLGDQEKVREIQIRRARERYFMPALGLAGEYSLRTEFGMALCFDILVQNGGIKGGARATIESALRSRPPVDERALALVIANAVADHARPAYQEDVRSRKLTVATGAGVVHGERFELEAWGLGPYPSAGP